MIIPLEKFGYKNNENNIFVHDGVLDKTYYWLNFALLPADVCASVREYRCRITTETRDSVNLGKNKIFKSCVINKKEMVCD